MKPYPIDVDGMIRTIEKRLEELAEQQNLSGEEEEGRMLADSYLRGFLAMFYSLKQQGITETDSSKVDLRRLMMSMGMKWRGS